VSKWPVAAFVALAIATAGAFFVVQHLKVTTPFLTGAPAPFPATINPVSGGTCLVRNYAGQLKPVSFRRMKVSFYLLHRADDVDVDIVDPAGRIVAQLADGRQMATKQRTWFDWNGRGSDGKVVPDGQYFIRVSLIHQGRSLLISNNAGAEPVTVQVHPPPLRVTAITGANGAAPAVIPRPGSGAPVTIHFTGNDGLRPQILIYSAGASGPPRLVKSYAATSRSGSSAWNGTLAGGRPAPPGNYLVALSLVDRACTKVTFPSPLPPRPTGNNSVTVA
jgi:FlgD Ig-like domain